jgi:hypothetical protein
MRCLGDIVSVRVTQAVLFGTSKPRAFSRPPIGGYLIDDIVKALAMVKENSTILLTI